jgi:hypothetical protein
VTRGWPGRSRSRCSFSHLSESPEFKQRFECEARAISSLSHLHICALHDVGCQDGVEYLVMEYLEGETLAERLSKGAVPLTQLLGFSIEIAEALDKAHRQGIVHRDLKPGNVMLTKSGVKLLDFGLAKALTPNPSPGGVSTFPTEAGPGQHLTERGTILGTFQYMAPEQLEGKEADARTDIFALGAVLYEMATGRKAFEGSSQASLFSAILRDEPRSISQAAPMTPSELDRVVKTCLAKNPDDRWQSAHDVATELKWIAKGGSQTGMPVAARPALRARSAWMLAAVQSRPPQLVIYPTGAGETRRLERGDLENYATAQWFRDGKTVLICGNEPGKGTRFYVQEIGGGAPRPVTPAGTRDGWLSPDGTLVLARGSGATYSVYPIAGGEPMPVPGLAEADVVAQWSTDGRSVLVYRAAEIPCRLERVDIATGQRSLFKELAPADRAGLLSMRGIFVTDDLRSYAYTTYYQVSSLFVSEGRR